MSHEFTHLLVSDAAGTAYSLVPAWLNEGLAEYGNIDPTDDYPAALRFGIFTRRVKPLWYLSTFGGTPDDIIMAYGQARSVIRFMVARYGEDSIADLMLALGDTLDIDEAMKRVYEVDQHGMDTLWRASLGLDPLPPPGELARRLEETQTPQPEVIAVPESSPSPEPTVAAAVEEEKGVATSGCNAPVHGQMGTGPVSLATLLLLGSPLALLSFRGLRRRR